MRGLRRVLVAAGVALASTRAPTARADPPAQAARDVLVVEVDAGSSGVAAETLRAAIGSELGADAVAPGDDRASRARGTVSVTIDKAAGSLVVSYREKGAPIVRKMGLPAGADATLRAAVLLAGNLARDEASELAQMLRKKPPPPKPAAGPLDPDDLVEDPQLEQKSLQDVEQMGDLLDKYSDHHRTLRTAVTVALYGAAVGADVAGFYLVFRQPVNQERQDGGSVLLGGGLSLVALGGLTEHPTGYLDQVKDYYGKDRASGRPASLVRQDLESVWLGKARTERRRRKLASILGLASAGLDVGVTIVVLRLAPSTWSMAPFLVQPAAAAAALGIAPMAGPGPAESALRAYERATGRKVLTDDGPHLVPVIAPTVGGGIVGLSGRF